MDERGQLGPVEFVLPGWLDWEERYSRKYKPVTPASRVVTGADDKIAPETDIATWAINDWSAGEGDTRWRDRGRYRVSDGAAPLSDGSGVSLGYDWSVASAQSTVITRGGGRLVAAGDMDDSIYEWNGSGWSSLWSIGGSAFRNAASMAAVDSTAWFVLDDAGNIRKVESGANSDHYSGGDFNAIVVYEGVLYGLSGLDLYEIDTSTASTRTLVSDTNVGEFVTDTRVSLLSTSDVGPIWLSPTSDGKTLIKEYNKADDVGYVVGELPSDSHAYDIGFFSGIYLVGLRAADSHSSVGGAYLYYQAGGLRGVAGPFRADSSTASDRVALAGVLGDRIHVGFQRKLWAYDLTTGGISQVADWSSSSLGDGYGAVTFGREIFVTSGAAYGVFDTEAFYTGGTQTLSTGLYDYGYLGLPKLVHTVTVTTEGTISGGDSVEVGYVVDGNTVEWLSGAMTSGASNTWTVSTSSHSVIGTEIEWKLRLDGASSSQAPVVVALHSDVSGAVSRIEWAVAIDVGRSSLVEGEDVIAALNALKTGSAVVQWSDPFQVNPYSADQTFDVRVLDVSTPQYVEGEGTSALVKFQTVGTVGPTYTPPA